MTLELLDDATGAILGSARADAPAGVWISGSDQGNDQLTVDFRSPFAPAGGIWFSGGRGGFDSLVIKGDNSLALRYQAVGAQGGSVAASGLAGATTISFTGLEPVLVSGLDSYTFATSDLGGVDQIIIDSPEPGQNRISGTSGGIAFESITFFNVTHVTIDTGANDADPASAADTVTIAASGLLADGLAELTILTGAGDDLVSFAGSPGSVKVDINAGDGADSLDLSGVSGDLRISLHPDATLSVSQGVSAILTTAGMESVIGSAGTTTYVFQDGASIAGVIGGAFVRLDYSACRAAVSIDLAAGTATGTGGVSNVVQVTGAGTITGQRPGDQPLSVHLIPETPLNVPEGLVVESITGTGIVNGRLIVAGTTVIEIGGSNRGVSYDAIDVTGGVLNLGGTLEIQITGGYETGLRPGFSFDILTAEGGIQGAFADMTGLAIGEIIGSDGSTRKLFFDVDLHSDPNKLTLTVLGTGHQMIRPLLFIPGFGGTFAADETPAGVDYWLQHRGIEPWLLALDPLTNAYGNLVTSFENLGYTMGVDLFVANWDWRVPVATSDLVIDGVLEGVSAAGISDGVFQTGLDYLGYWLSEAVTAWSLLGNPALTDVDIVTHSTGGLVSRSYIQSEAYNDFYGPGGAFRLPEVHNLVQVGVPNQGLTGTYNFLHDDFAQKLASRVLGRVLDAAYDLLQDGIFNPDGSRMDTGLSEVEFIPAYVGTLKDLLATYDGALDLGSGLGRITAARAGVENTLLFDLNGGADPNRFVDLLTGSATIIYSNEVDTEDQIVLQTGPDLSLGLSNEILPFSQYIGNWPDEGTVWYLDRESNTNPDAPGATEGDGTIASISSVGLFLGDSRIGSKLFLVPMSGGLGHTDLANAVSAQQQIIKAVMGTLPDAGQIVTGLELGNLDAALKLLDLGLFDISEFGSELVARLGPTLLDIGGTAVGSLSTMVFDLAMQNLSTLLEGYTLDETLSLGDAGTVAIKFDVSTGLELTADLDLAIGSFVYAGGNFTLRKPFSYVPVNLSSGVENMLVTPLEVTATNVTLFAGLNGPYWVDADGDRVFDASEANPHAVGLQVTDVDFGMVIFYPQMLSGLPTFYSLKATAMTAGLVGLEGVLQATVRNVRVEVNSSSGGTLGQPRIDFAASFPVDERLLLFDTDHNRLVTVGELRVLNGTPEYGGLYNSAASDNQVVALGTLLNTLDANHDGMLGAAEAAALAGTTAVLAADKDGDGKLDPRGYEIRTGTGLAPVYLDYDGSQRMAASADSVLLQISQFVYVTGSFSIQMGPAETVEVATGLPANLGDIAESLLDSISGIIPLEGTVGLGDLQITTDLSTIKNLPVRSLQMGISGAHVFVGLNGPYKIDTDGDGSVADETAVNEDAVGLVIDDVDLGFVTMVSPLAALPGLDKILPTFFAVKATAASAGLVGLEGILQASLEKVLVEVNDSGGWPGGLGSPVINFANSFATDERLLLFDTGPGHDGLITVGELRGVSGMQSYGGLYTLTASDGQVVALSTLMDVLDTNDNGMLEVTEAAALAGAAASGADQDGDGKLDPAGYEIRTGTTTEPVYLTFNGDQRIGAAAQSVLLRISQFVYVIGSLSFEKGPGYRVEVATGFPGDLAGFASGILDALNVLPKKGTIGLGEDALSISTDFSTIYNLEVDSMQIGFSGAHVFVGLNGPYKIDTDGDGLVSDETGVNQDAIGLVVNNADFGFVMMAPTLAALPGLDSVLPKFYALKASADLVGFVGLPAVEMTLEGIRVGVNTGKEWPGGVFGAPVINFANSFATDERLLLFDTGPGHDGLVTVGELRGLNGAQSYNGLYNSAANNGQVVALSTLLDVLDTDASGTLEVSEAAALAGATAASGADVDGDGKLDPPGLEIRTGVDTPPVYIDFDGNERIGASVAQATIRISEFVYITGSVAFEKGPGATVNTAGGLLGQVTADVGKLLNDYGLPADTPIPVLDTVKEVGFMTIGAADVHAFVGINGPYWVDADGDGEIDRDPVTGKIVPAEVNPEAVGLVLDDLDFGMAMMSPSNPLDPGKYFALHASARSISLAGIDGVTVQAEQILVEVNQSSPTIYGVSLFPVVDFATTPAFADERLPLFDTNDDGLVTVGELRAASGQNAFSGLYGAGDSADKVLDTELIAQALDTDASGTLEVGEAAALMGASAAAAADADGDGKIDPLGLEVQTGGEPVYLAMGTSLIRAQGFVELKIFDALYLTGSIAFELGPTQQVTLTDGSTKTVTTMTIGAANVTAFIGANGPYWTDTDGDHSVDTNELSSSAVGFHITDLDVGLMVMASVSLSDVGVYLAAKASVDSFGVVGIDMLEATGRFDIAINVGIGTASGVSVVDFPASFNEVLDLFDTNDDGTITVGELRMLAGQGPGGAYADLYTSTDADAVQVSWANVASALDTNEDGLLQVDEVKAFLSNDTLAEAADADRSGTLDVGFKVNTGDPTSPAVLVFDQFLISFQLGGQVTIYDGPKSDPSSNAVVRLNGLLLLEVDSAGLKAFVAAGLEFGPDIGASGGAKLFDMNALGGLVINASGIAADIDVSVSVGGALSSVLAFNARARIVFNTTGVDQTITIPQRYVAFLKGTVDLSGSFIESELNRLGIANTTALSGLTGTLDARFVVNPDGSAAFTIRGSAPRLDGTFESPGAYFLVSLHGDLTIASVFVITADFQLKISGEGLYLALAGKVDLSIFGKLDVTGGAVIKDGVFAMYADLGVHVFDGIPGINISGNFTLKINTGSEQVTIGSRTIEPHTYLVAIGATIDLFGLFHTSGDLVLGAQGGILGIAFNNISIDFFGIVDIGISGYIYSNGSFSLAGELALDLTIGSGITEFGIRGSLGVAIKNTGVSGHGSVALVILGEDINIASAALSVDWQAGTFRIRAEGPLGVWLEVTGNGNSWDIDGGLGVFDAIFDAIGAAAEAAGEALVVAAEAVADAFVDLGEAILDFGSDVVDFFDGLFTDIGNLIGDLVDEISSWFESSKTEVYDLTSLINPFDYYSYSASLSGPANQRTLTINNSSASRLRIAVVDGNLIVDAPDVTRSVLVAEKVNYTRYFRWKWGFIPLGWSDWSIQSIEYLYRDVAISNMRYFAAGTISRIIIYGTNAAETIVADGNSVAINMEVYGYGGNDVIVTGKGNDSIQGGDGNDTIFANEGNDYLYGGNGDDKLLGGTGNDHLYGESGNDLLDESYGRASPNTLISETNTLDGGPGDDQLLGSPGIDTITGGSGNDLLLGLYHNDIYRFEENFGSDTLADYYGISNLHYSGTGSGTTIVADEVVISAAGPITLMTTVNTLTAATSGVGDITITETDSIILSNVTTANGSISVTAGAGDITVGRIVAGGSGSVTLMAAGSVEEYGSDPDMDITAYALDIDAGWGIGTEGAIETAASLIAADTTDGVIDLDNTLTSPVSVTSLTTGAGDILFSQAGGGPLAVALAQTADGDILIDVSGAALRVGTVTAGGIGQNISLTTIGSGDIEVGSVEAAEDRITITSAGAITDGVGKIAAHELIATAGGSMVLDTSVDTLTATNHGELTVVETDAIITDNRDRFDHPVERDHGEWFDQRDRGCRRHYGGENRRRWLWQRDTDGSGFSRGVRVGS